uniref:protein-serine/threonine phosphatase n=1 Tax=Aegilops tauschii TaxID=37682 RepID=M8BPM6_AEGTA
MTSTLIVSQHLLKNSPNFGSKDGTIFCGVFDGHGPQGHLVSKMVRDLLPVKLSANIARDEYKELSNNRVTNGTTEGDAVQTVVEDTDATLGAVENGGYPEIFTALRTSFLRAFYVMDRDLKSHKNIDCLFSGTTAVTLIKQGQDLIIGNLGDSRAILATKDEDNHLFALQLTVDLKPSIPSEAARIRERKGRVFSLPNEPDVTRVWLPKYNSPGLAMARAFGDFCLKSYGVISVPDVSYHHITEKDEFVVLATDGVWDVLSNDDVVKIVSESTSEASAARLLVQTAHRTKDFATNVELDGGKHFSTVKSSTVVPTDLATAFVTGKEWPVLSGDPMPATPTNLLTPTSAANQSMEG